MNILPDVQILPDPTWWEDWNYASTGGGNRVSNLRPMVEGGRFATRPGSIFDEQFGELFTPEGDGYRAIWRKPMRELLITWETGR